MPSGRRLVLPLLLIGLAASVPAGAGEEENWQRLRAMPRERRLDLAGKIREFDRLGRAEKEAIRDLDRRLGSLPPDVQANYRAVLRRYHLWLQSLPADKRDAVEAAPPAARMALVAKLLAEESKAPAKEAGPLIFQLADAVNASPFEMAHTLQVWFHLSPAERSEIEAVGALEGRKRLSALGRSMELKPLPRPGKADLDAALAQLEKDRRLKGWLGGQLLKQAEPEKPLVDRARLATNYYYLVTPPKPVAADELLRFETAMPSWLRASFDHLPPEEARRRLTILYHLVGSDWKESSKAEPAAKGTAAPATTPRPAPPTPKASPPPPTAPPL